MFSCFNDNNRPKLRAGNFLALPREHNSNHKMASVCLPACLSVEKHLLAWSNPRVIAFETFDKDNAETQASILSLIFILMLQFTLILRLSPNEERVTIV